MRALQVKAYTIVGLMFKSILCVIYCYRNQNRDSQCNDAGL